MNWIQVLPFTVMLSVTCPLAASGAGYSYVSFLSIAGAPTDQFVAPSGINDDGVIVGNDGAQGFIYANKATSHVAIPGAAVTALDSIDRTGGIIGHTYTELLGERVGFSFSDIKAVLKPIVLNGVAAGVAGANSRGEFIAVIDRNGHPFGETYRSHYNDSPGSSPGYILKSPRIFSPPGANTTIPSAINDHGQIVGFSYDTTGEHGFVLSRGAYTKRDEAHGHQQPWHDRGHLLRSEPQRT